MDREPEEFQHMGLCGIYREAYKVTVSWWKIFLQTTFSLILPLSLLHLAQLPILIFNLQVANFINTQDGISLQLIVVYIFQVAYVIFILNLYLVLISIIVYTIASIYCSKEVNLKKVTSVVPKVSKRLVVTYLWNLLIIFLYTLLAVILIALFVILISVLLATGAIRPDGEKVITYYIVFGIVLSIPYLIGAMYISIVWHIANVVSVLEETYGLEALKKSRNLIKGKIWIVSAIFVELQILFSVTTWVFIKFVVQGESIAMVGRISLGILCILLLTILIHFVLVIITILYFVCKSYHNENIDKSYIIARLNAYHQGVYAPLISDQNV